MTTLLEVANSPLPPHVDEKLDLPHTHALNILKALFREAGLAGSMAKWLEEATICAIKGLAIGNWGVSNSATQLYCKCGRQGDV